MCIRVCLYVCVHVCLYVCVHVCLYVCVHVECMDKHTRYGFLYIHMSPYIPVHMHIHTFSHNTHTHTHTAYYNTAYCIYCTYLMIGDVVKENEGVRENEHDY